MDDSETGVHVAGVHDAGLGIDGDTPDFGRAAAQRVCVPFARVENELADAGGLVGSLSSMATMAVAVPQRLRPGGQLLGAEHAVAAHGGVASSS